MSMQSCWVASLSGLYTKMTSTEFDSEVCALDDMKSKLKNPMPTAAKIVTAKNPIDLFVIISVFT